ncbi:MAG: RidA family protein [Kofleriaceae bacterium]
MRQTILSGSPFEATIGFARAVRIGANVAIAGTAPIGKDGKTVAPGDVYAQTRRCIEIAEAALLELGLSLDNVIRTRVMLVDISRHAEAARAHGERFRTVRPATTFVEVSRFIDPEWLVEIELDAIAS